MVQPEWRMNEGSEHCEQDESNAVFAVPYFIPFFHCLHPIRNGLGIFRSTHITSVVRKVLCSRQRENLFEIVDRKWAIFSRVEKLHIIFYIFLPVEWIQLFCFQFPHSVQLLSFNRPFRFNEFRLLQVWRWKFIAIFHRFAFALLFFFSRNTCSIFQFDCTDYYYYYQ